MFPRPDPTTLAGQVLSIIQAQSGIRALSVEAGYGIDDQGDRFMLEVPPPRVTKMKRNAKDRCTSATFQYQDGSVLEFAWSEDRGARYHQGKPVTLPPPAPVAESPDRPRRRLRLR